MHAILYRTSNEMKMCNAFCTDSQKTEPHHSITWTRIPIPNPNQHSSLQLLLLSKKQNPDIPKTKTIKRTNLLDTARCRVSI